MAAAQKRVPVDIDAKGMASKRQKTSLSSDFAADGNHKTSPRIDRADDNDALAKTVIKSSVPTCNDASDVVATPASPASESTAKNTREDTEGDLEYDESTKAQIKADNAAKITRIRSAMTSAFPDFVFVTEFEAEDDDVWQPDPIQFGTLSANKTLDGALDQVADYFEHWGAMEILVEDYNKEQEKLGNVSFIEHVTAKEERAALLDSICWSGEESRGSKSISAKVNDAGTDYTITIKRVPLLA